MGILPWPEIPGSGTRRQRYQAVMTSGSEGRDGDTAVSDQVVFCQKFSFGGTE